MVGGFMPYVEHLESLAAGPHVPVDRAELNAHLDREAGRRLRGTIRVEELRELGAFFTGESLADRLMSLVPQDRRRYVDWACGCGDLLLAASKRLPVETSLEATLTRWNRQLFGIDVVPAFVRATRARLVLAAMSRGAVPDDDLSDPPSCLPTSPGETV
jgi:hypothetical protein